MTILELINELNAQPLSGVHTCKNDGVFDMDCTACCFYQLAALLLRDERIARGEPTMVTVLLNHTPIKMHEGQITFEQISTLTHTQNGGRGPIPLYTVCYSKKGGGSGCLAPGQSVGASDGLRITAMVTGNA